MLYNLFENRDFVSVFAVALLAEGVDRNRYNESRKSIPWQWAEQEGIEVKAKRLRVHWRYDVDALLKRLENENAKLV